MTTLTKPLKRSIRVHGIDSPINLVISEEGLSMAIPGMKTKLAANWLKIAEALYTPGNVPSFLEGKPVEFLKHQVSKKG